MKTGIVKASFHWDGILLDIRERLKIIDKGCRSEVIVFARNMAGIPSGVLLSFRFIPRQAFRISAGCIWKRGILVTHGVEEREESGELLSMVKKF